MSTIHFQASTRRNTFYRFLQNRKNSNTSLLKKICANAALLLPMIFFVNNSSAQLCGVNTPVYTVDLSNSPDSLWISPSVARQDTCCGATGSDVCVEFIVTIHPSSKGIVFNIHSGAMPSGSMYYKLECGPETAVGAPLCLTTPGPHHITFCKPGNNVNEYSITAIGETEVSPNITINDGCSGTLKAVGYDVSTVTWNSVYPGTAGAYNSYLNCASGCDSVTITADGSAPSYIDYQVCGMPLGGCVTLAECHVVRVSFNPTLFTNITPLNPTVCYGAAGTTITANVTGGLPPYTYTWSNGQTTQTAFVTAGTYTVSVKDASNCPAVTASVVVTSFTQPITANAGADKGVCLNNTTISLNGVITGASGGIWSNGQGTFNSSVADLTATYTPTSTEVANGFVSLTLTTTGNGTCPSASDNIVISLHTFNAQTSITSSDVKCFGLSNGSASVSLTGGPSPFTYSWSTSPVQTSASANNLSAGTYTVSVTDANGCSKSLEATINQPNALNISTGSISNAACNGGNDGLAMVSVTGGTSPYTYSWNSNPVQNTATAFNLSAGYYTAIVADANGCQSSITITISQPQAIITTLTGASEICPGQSSTLVADATGGSGGFTYSWVPNLGNGNIYSVNPSETTTYSVRASDSKGCYGNEAFFTVKVFSLSPADVSMTLPPPICEGNSAQISCTVNASAGAVTYLWSPFVGTGPGPYTVSPAASTNYTVTITNTCGAAITKTTGVTVNPLPEPAPPSQTAQGCDKVVLTFDANNPSSASGDSYLWSFGDGSFSVQPSPTHEFTTTGIFTIRVDVTTAAGCKSAASLNANIIIYATPDASFEVSKNEVSMRDPVIYFDNNSSHAKEVLWSFGDGATSTLMDPSHTYGSKGKYRIVLVTWSEGGCVDSTERWIEVTPELLMFIPNAFSPNGDGKNDFFLPQGDEITKFTMEIFNRWGELIFTSSSLNEGWDGRGNGGKRVAQNDVYVYKISVQDYKNESHQYLGHVSLVK